MPSEFLPRYPVEPEPKTFIITQEENPDIIQGPPIPFNDQVGAINERLLDEYQTNEVRKLAFKHFYGLMYFYNFRKMKTKQE